MHVMLPQLQAKNFEWQCFCNLKVRFIIHCCNINVGRQCMFWSFTSTFLSLSLSLCPGSAPDGWHGLSLLGSDTGTLNKNGHPQPHPTILSQPYFQALYNLPLPSACVWSSQTASGAYFKVSTLYAVHSSLKCGYFPHVKYVGHVTVTRLSHGITQSNQHMAISLQSHESHMTFCVLVHTQEVDIQSYSQIVGSDHPGAGR